MSKDKKEEGVWAKGDRITYQQHRVELKNPFCGCITSGCTVYGRQLVAGDAGGNSFAERFDMVPFLIVIGKDWATGKIMNVWKIMN